MINFFIGLVIIGDFDVVGILAVPTEADAILVVCPDTVPAGPVAFDRFEPIARRKARFVQG